MPIQSEILKVILDYLYTDEAVVIKGTNIIGEWWNQQESLSSCAVFRGLILNVTDYYIVISKKITFSSPWIILELCVMVEISIRTFISSYLCVKIGEYKKYNFWQILYEISSF